ncbi:MAG: hypothetical protein ABSH51_06230 [Solirubrobacteraceae bacterium]
MRRVRRLAASVAVTLAALVWAPPALAAVASAFTVTGLADSPVGTCTSPDGGGASTCTTLRAAIDQADTQSNAPTIRLAAGTYELTAAGGGQLAVTASMTIDGVGPGTAAGTTIAQTDGVDRVLELSGSKASLTLTDLEITGGDLSSAAGQAQGGGILSDGDLTLQFVDVMGNTAAGAAGAAGSGAGGQTALGGGIYTDGTATTTITASIVSGNTVEGGDSGSSAGGDVGVGGDAWGGGIAATGSGTMTIVQSTVSGNTATAGDGGASPGGTPGDGGFAWGGAVYAAGILTMEASTVAGNTVTGGAGGSASAPGGDAAGGGIGGFDAPVTIVNSTLFANSAQAGAPLAYPDGVGYGGGVQNYGPVASLTLASDTIADNQASYAAGDLDVDVGMGAPYPYTIADTIIAAGAAPSSADCDITTAAMSDSYNLEDDAGGQCGFTAADHDLTGVNPALPPPPLVAVGSRQTLAPSPVSPVLGAGGECLDPTSTPAEQPLSTDERLVPRPNPCDIGAFQHQPAAVATAPSIAGFALVGDTLTCAGAAFSGDGVAGPTYQWQRNGVAIAGAVATTYVVVSADQGTSLSCVVTAAGTYGDAIAPSAPVIVPTKGALPQVKLAGARRSGTRTAATLACRGPAGERCAGKLTLLTTEFLRGRKVVAVGSTRARHVKRRAVTVAGARYSLAAGRTSTVRLSLNATGRRLLSRFHRLPVRLAVVQTIGTAVHRVATTNLTIAAQKPAKRRRR